MPFQDSTPHRAFLTFAVILFGLATGRLNAFDGAEVVSYYGFDDCIRLYNDDINVVLCPAAGGRVLEYSRDGKNVLSLSPEGEGWSSSDPQNDGSAERPLMDAGRFDIGPEKLINRGEVLWSGKWDAEITGNRSARLTSQYDPKSGVRLVREFQLHETTSQLRCSQTTINESKERVNVCHWGRTFAVGGGIVVVPRTANDRFPSGYVMYEGGRNMQLHPKDSNILVDPKTVVVTGPPKHAKLGFDSHAGWFAYLAPDDHMFVKRFKTFPDRPYNEIAGLTVSVWYPQKDRVELEPIGPAELLKPGKRATFVEQWWLLPYEFPSSTTSSSPNTSSPEEINLSDIRKIVARQTRAAGKEPGTIISPEVHEDRRVTFRFSGLESKSVNVMLNHRPTPLKRDADGVWKVTTKPMSPGVHEYVFEVDGVRVTDPRNRWLKKWFQCASLFEVPSDDPLLTQQSDVDHGVVHRHVYQSQTTGGQRAAVVYTPPNYDINAAEPYPLMVLCHGHGDDETAWTEVGRAHLIFDNLIAAGKITPMVVVMPNGHPVDLQQHPWSEEYHIKNAKTFVKDVIEDVVPMIERQYHVSDDPQRKAITGLSMGGGHSIMMAMDHPKEFAWVGAFSAAAPGEPFAEDHPEWIPASEGDRSARKLFWIGCGVDDFLLERNHQFVEQLKLHSIPHTYVETAGSHSWNVWREYLPTFTQLLFR
ncbi:alpha/beta hydrolase-fold protein [Rhodopirellula sallentina]|uniref:Esterase n=1 Tax=Rhodopirellula sallentina SM41 TaxID=1263870 RepID=M5U491_9BACT|nr:alpha/beta hydrolase-fold protein [Rhodopirellula sallentina]EMI56260.1 esterase [Rhodopirellula sallentina SM41]